MGKEKNTKKSIQEQVDRQICKVIEMGEVFVTSSQSSSLAFILSVQNSDSADDIKAAILNLFTLAKKTDG